MSKFEQVVCVRAESIKSKLPLHGFLPVEGTEEEKSAKFKELFKAEEVVIGSRHWLENDRTFLQLIPSIVFRKPDGTVLVYQRVKGTGELRLLGNSSCNVGGHVNAVDLHFDDANNIDISLTIWNSLFREVSEELGVELGVIIDIPYDSDFNEFKGVIFDTSNDVGKVHVGLLYVFDVEQDCEFNSEVAESEGMVLSGWYTPSTILHHHDIDAIHLENWAKIVLEHLA